MEKLKELAKESNISTQLLNKGEAVIMSVFESSIESFSDLFNHSFQKRQFENLIKILTLTQKYLETQKITPQKVELKTLVPLIEYASLEEDKLFQKKWAKLIVYIVSNRGKMLLKQNLITILNKITKEEVKFIDYFYDKYLKKLQEQKKENLLINEDEIYFDIRDLYNIKTRNWSNTEYEDNKLFISNLVSLGILRWRIFFEMYSSDFQDITEFTDIGIGSFVYHSDSFFLTYLGREFASICHIEA